MVIAVVDRMGNILAVYQEPSAPALSTGNFGNQVATPDLAVALARTGAFFSNDQAPLSSRTVRYISGVHFPPGVANAPNAALYGIEPEPARASASLPAKPTRWIATPTP